MKRAFLTLIWGVFGAAAVLLGSSTAGAAPMITVQQKDVEHPTNAESSEKIKQRFNPIFGSEGEANEIISFISSNLVVELESEQIKRLDGYMIATFIVDTMGNIDRINVKRSYNTWVDYAIIGALNNLPPLGRKSYDKRDNLVERQHDIAFTFGSYVKGSNTYGFQGAKVRDNTQQQLNEQRDTHFAEVNKQRGMWSNFTDVNAKLEYNIKDGLRDEARTLRGDDPFAYPKPPPLTTPTIKITQRD